MTVSKNWKLMFWGWGLASVLPLSAQVPALPPPPPGAPPTQAQLALVSQIQGIGDIKFGATRESFDQDSLQSITGYSGDPVSMLSFQDSKVDTV
ncbi:MAG TPA: hypothetical protein VGC39_06785, partial [Candidatus Methylacidiphilales bacterium]